MSARNCRRYSLSTGEAKRVDLLLPLMRRASPLGSRLTATGLVRAALARGFDVLAMELHRRLANPQPFDAGPVAPLPEDDAVPPSTTRPRGAS